MFVATERQLVGEKKSNLIFRYELQLPQYNKWSSKCKNNTGKLVHFDEMKMLARVLSEGIPHAELIFTKLTGMFISVNLLSLILEVLYLLSPRNGIID